MVLLFRYVRGLMIAQDYTPLADAIRRSLETLQDVRLRFRTWDRVIEDTERMHLGRLPVSKERVEPNNEAATYQLAEIKSEAAAASDNGGS